MCTISTKWMLNWSWDVRQNQNNPYNRWTIKYRKGEGKIELKKEYIMRVPYIRNTFGCMHFSYIADALSWHWNSKMSTEQNKKKHKAIFMYCSSFRHCICWAHLSSAQFMRTACRFRGQIKVQNASDHHSWSLISIRLNLIDLSLQTFKSWN